MDFLELLAYFCGIFIFCPAIRLGRLKPKKIIRHLKNIVHLAQNMMESWGRMSIVLPFFLCYHKYAKKFMVIQKK